jgi:CO/xanthine dehydrogenase FAD-binding subunit
MKPPLFRYEAPRTLRDAVAVLASDSDAMVLAGGQSLVPAMNFRVATPSLLVDIQHVEGLKGIAIESDTIVIKAMTRHRELELHPGVRRVNPLIAETMQHVAHVPIRNRGTVVGSLCHADPSAEMPLLFVLLDGTLVATGPAGTRQIPAADFFQSFLTTARHQDEIVVEARLPVLPAGAGFAFDEVTRRHGDFALVGIGCVLSLDGNGRAQNVRLAACGISDRPVRLKAAEAALTGSVLAAGDLAAAARACANAVTQTDDMNTSMSYRRRVLSGLLQRLVPIAAGRASAGNRQ